MTSRRCSPLDTAPMLRALDRPAERVAGEERLLCLVHLEVERLVVRTQGVGLPVDVRQHPGPDDRRAVLRAVALGPGAVAVEAVAELAGALVHEEAVLPQPTLAVGGVEGVEVEVAAEGVQWDAGRRRFEAVDRPPEVRERAEDVLVLTI